MGRHCVVDKIVSYLGPDFPLFHDKYPSSEKEDEKYIFNESWKIIRRDKDRYDAALGPAPGTTVACSKPYSRMLSACACMLSIFLSGH